MGVCFQKNGYLIFISDTRFFKFSNTLYQRIPLSTIVLFQFAQIQLFISHTLTAPGIYGMQFAILALNDGRIRILADGAVFQCHYILPVNAIIETATHNGVRGPFGVPGNVLKSL